MRTTSLCEDFVTASLAAAAATPNVRRASVRALFDYWGCVASGSREMPQPPFDQAGRLAFQAHLGDMDDLHLGTLTHPGGVVWSAAIAAGLERSAAIEDVLRAGAFGYEVTIRLAEALGPEHRLRWHVTTTAGTVGAAGAAALLLGSDRETVVGAVAHAMSVTGGSANAMIERSGTRFLHRAHAATSGLECARAASAGVGASTSILESGSGALGGVDPDALRGSLLGRSERACIEEVGFRLHGATGFAHAAIDAALELGPVEPATVERVDVTISPPAALRLASNPSPADDTEAWWSIEHAVAVALATGGAGPLTPGLSDQPEIHALCQRVCLTPDADGRGATVRVTMTGQVRSMVSVEPAGHLHRPASDRQLIDKWSRLSGGNGAAAFERLATAGELPLSWLLEALA